jgi:hypothetical protein
MKVYMFPVVFCLFASALFGDSIPTYFASSATITNEHGADTLSAQAPYFQISGVVNDYTGARPPILDFEDGTGEFATITVDFLRNGLFFLTTHEPSLQLRITENRSHHATTASSASAVLHLSCPSAMQFLS